MMSYDERTIYENSMTKGYNLERDGSYKMAIARYSYSREIASGAKEESSVNRAQEAIDRCEEKIKRRDEEFVK